jgi:hypothetical protein
LQLFFAHAFFIFTQSGGHGEKQAVVYRRFRLRLLLRGLDHFFEFLI